MDANTIKKLREIYDEKMRLIKLRSNLEKRVEELKNDPTVIEYFKVLRDLDENKRKCDDGLIRDEYDVCCYLSEQDSILSNQSSKIFFRGPAVKIEFEKGYKDNDLHPYETAVDELEKNLIL